MPHDASAEARSRLPERPDAAASGWLAPSAHGWPATPRPVEPGTTERLAHLAGFVARIYERELRLVHDTAATPSSWDHRRPTRGDPRTRHPQEH